MGGKHISYLFEGNYEDILKEVHNDLVSIVEDYVEDYDYCGLDLIQLMIISVKRLPELELENINKLKLDKKLVRIGETRRNFNSLILPLTMNEYYYGNKLDKVVKNDNIKSDIYVRIINVIMDDKNIIPLIEKNSILVNKVINGSYDLDFYEFINKRNKKYIIVVKKIDNRSNMIEVFDKNGNNLVFAEDLKINDVEFKRKIGKFSLTIKHDVISKYEVNDTLPIIKPLEPEFKSVRNTNIGSFDVETYFNKKEDKSYVYALGYKILNDNKKMFFKSNSQSSYELIIECINSMLISKYNGFTFYVHNFSGFDVVFILSALEEYNSNNNDYYKFYPIFRDDKIIKLSVGIKTKSGLIKITFVDSYNLLNKKLEQLSIEFDCSNTKGKFCHSFVNESTLNYIGNTPDKDYFDGVDDKEYNLIKKQN